MASSSALPSPQEWTWINPKNSLSAARPPDAAADSRQTAASRSLQFQFAFAIRGVRQASTDILIRQIGKFAQDILMAHPARQVFQHIIDSDTESSDAWLPTALSRLQSDHLGVVHSAIIAGLTCAVAFWDGSADVFRGELTLWMNSPWPPSHGYLCTILRMDRHSTM